MINLVLGDCLEKMKDIPDKSIDSIITDPPYGTTACKWDSIIPFEPMWEELKRIRNDNSVIILFGQNLFSYKLAISNESEFRYPLIWEKTKAGGFLNARRMPLSAHEDILVFYKKLPNYFPQKTIGKPYTKKAITNGDGNLYGKFDRIGSVNINNGDRYPRSVIKFSNANNKTVHPTQKPLELIEYLIKTYTLENETVLDFTMGSFTTAIACLNTKRNFIGIEKDENYFKIGTDRVEKHLLTLDYKPEVIYN
jgi:site-specific DNA-methyltransferase (adenine-specific)